MSFEFLINYLNRYFFLYMNWIRIHLLMWMIIYCWLRHLKNTLIIYSLQNPCYRNWDFSHTQQNLKKKHNFMTPFYEWGSTASRLQPLPEGFLIFTTKFPGIHGNHFIDLGRMKGWNWYFKHDSDTNIKKKKKRKNTEYSCSTAPKQLCSIRTYASFLRNIASSF